MDQPLVDGVDNRTDFTVHPQLLLDRDGEKLSIIVKATFELHLGSSEVELAPPERQRPVRFADEPWDKDSPESVALPADVCIRKPATDVLVVANAFAPGGAAVPSFDVRVEVGALAKSITVFGRRLWADKGALLTAPSPIAEIAMRYEHAWGGRDDKDPSALVEEPRNPIGRGVARDPSALTHAIAPNLEDPLAPIRNAGTAPPPAGIGPIGRSWEPRRRYAGTYDAAWQEQRAPLLPDDFDDRFNQCASPGLIADPPLRGGELVKLLNLTPGGGAVSFAIPVIALEIAIQVKDRPLAIATPPLDTLLIDARAVSLGEPIAVEMVYRAYVPAPRRMKHARVVVRERMGA